MKLSLLGSAELVTAGGERWTIGSRRQRQLLAALALSRSSVVAVDRLVEVVWWPDIPADPVAAVQTVVSRLRRGLADPLVIETEAEGYILRCPEESLDLARFQQLVEQVRTDQIGRRPDLAAAALGLWRGTPFADLDHPDVEAERQRLQELRVEIGELQAEALCDLGRYNEALDVAEQISREHPYRERPVASLMRALYGSGRQGDALVAFADLRSRLLDDLGVDPSVELRDLELAVLRQDVPAAVPDGTGLASGRAGAVATPDDPVRRPGQQTAPGRTSGPLQQRIRMCAASDGAGLAYAVSGQGPPLVRAAHWMTHLDYDWESLVWGHWNAALSSNRTLIRYDERGCGLSDWDVDGFGFDAWVDDLAAVVDELGLERFPLLGISQGGAVAIAYAVRYPERVSHLVLFGAYAEGRGVRAATVEQKREAELNIELMRVGWGTGESTFRQVFTSQFMPEGTREQWEAFNELQRRTCSPENAVRFMEVFADIDVVDIAPKVTCPTLIMHARNELRVPFASAQKLATLIPDSELVPLESGNHILLESEPAWQQFLVELDRFLAGDESLDRS